ncbi:MAG: CvpA family protein [Rhodospirillaceae bacterium]|nr:CvpA family protein [Rhodospirillaceae bacterium]
MENWPFQIIDLVVIVVLLISAFLAYARGFVHEVLSVAGWIGAGFAALYGQPYVQPYVRQLIPSQMIADLATGTITFVVALAALSLLTRAISKLVQGSALNSLDRALGFLFGLARGAVLICLLYLGVQWLTPPDDQPQWMTEARTMPLITVGAAWIKMLLPDDAGEEGDKIKDQAIEKARQESLKVMEGLISPAPKGDDSQPAEGYDKKTRSAIENLIDNMTGNTPEDTLQQ